MEKVKEVEEKVLYPDEIQTVSAFNIEKFLDDYPGLSEQAPAIRERMLRISEEENPRRIFYRGGVISGRSTIIEILGESLAENFFRAVANSAEHRAIAIKNIASYRGSIGK